MAAKLAKSKPQHLPAPGLSSEIIVKTARELVRKHGLSKVSMRMLGAKLGVSAPAPYYYFPSKRDLFIAVAASIFEELAKVDTRAHWSEQLRAYVLAYQQRLIEYPGLARFLLANRDSRGGLLWTETILSILKRGGLSDERIGPALGMLVFFINPMTLVEERPRSSRPTLYDFKVVRRALDASPQAYPMLAELMGRQGDGKSFPFAYEALLPIVLDRIVEQIRLLAEAKR